MQGRGGVVEINRRHRAAGKPAQGRWLQRIDIGFAAIGTQHGKHAHHIERKGGIPYGRAKIVLNNNHGTPQPVGDRPGNAEHVVGFIKVGHACENIVRHQEGFRGILHAEIILHLSALAPFNVISLADFPEGPGRGRHEPDRWFTHHPEGIRSPGQTAA